MVLRCRMVADCPGARCLCWILLFVSVQLAGCARFQTEYGASEGVSGSESLNGFGALRAALEGSSANVLPEIQTHEVARLSQREVDNEALVWIPTAWPPINRQEVQQWLDRWLAQDGRTLIFIVPDAGSDEAYFREAADTAPPDQRLAYRRRLAQEINERILADANRSDVTLGGWFTAQSLPFRVSLSDRRFVDFSLVANPTVTAGNAAPPPPPATEQTHALEVLEQESVDAPSGSSKLTTLARLTSRRWKGSQVLLVPSGSLLTNFAMTDVSARAMAGRLANEIRRASDLPVEASIDVGFLSSSYSPVPISQAKAGFPKTKGWELMTEMPLSLINMHVAFLGIVLCLMLLPAFGRPRRIRYNRPTHFGNHLSAMAALMRRGGGTAYAKSKISQYLRQVRGETSGPWVQPPTDAADPATTSETKQLE
ncbi:hypothetical protein CA85_23280 [Allorhodopirellula solitaria]|uniref:DUF4350 domain-containing protein n=2 Tax=Allorhodopirellula solitaria TaxID=2527987 RepID=A0A5C5XVX4_9BACT|nr:hypothetical protein CA85_23280 [Allorhodopirellula solitaria]